MVVGHLIFITFMHEARHKILHPTLGQDYNTTVEGHQTTQKPLIGMIGVSLGISLITCAQVIVFWSS